MTRQKAFLELWLQEMKMGKNKTQMSFMNEPQADCIQQCSLVDAFTRQKPGLALRLLSEGLFYIRAMWKNKTHL